MSLRPRLPLRFESLEDRLVPALTFRFDYSLDGNGFFADPARRAALEAVGADLAALVTSTPAAVTPTGANAWQAIFTNPTTQTEVRLPNLVIPEGTLVVFVGAADIYGAGQGGPGGFWASGSSRWQQSLADRPGAGPGVWGGDVSFDLGQNYYFGSDPLGLTPGQVDFYSLAVHELTHVLGYGTSPEWEALTQGGRFTGAAATAEYGSAPPVSADDGHLAQGTQSAGEPISMQPVMTAGRRVALSKLDLAVLRDLGWQTTDGGASGGSVTTPTTGTTLPVTTVTPAPEVTWTPVPGDAKAGRLVVTSGPNDGTIQAYTGDANGRLTPVGPAMRPFGSFGGPVRTAVGDFNGDGLADIAAATGPGGGSQVRVLDGRTFTDLGTPFYAFEVGFGGGVFLAAGDFDADGRDELVVTPDQGGGPRVRVLTLGDGAMYGVADFFGIDDASFRGGARPAVGDITRDGVADLVVSAGFGGGPRVSLIDGTTVLAAGGRRNIGTDFFAFEAGLRNGSYAAVADVDGDGYGDLVFGAGPGGGPRLLALSGHTVTTMGGEAALAAPLANGFAGAESQRGGVRVSAKDLDGDGRPEVLTGAGEGGELRVYRPAGGGLSPVAFSSPFGAISQDGVYVG